MADAARPPKLDAASPGIAGLVLELGRTLVRRALGRN
ncbi:MAG: hypothetical protein JWQ32_3043 [Marmoricola sp.]|nr:hypothetical protein [Marmoricola sp.]